MSKKASSTRNEPPNNANGRPAVFVDRSNRSFAVQLPIGFILYSIICVGLVAFGIGRLSATFAVLSLSRGIMQPEGGESRALPPPLYSSKKKIPLTVYSSKHYDSGAVSTSDTLLARRAHFGEPIPFENFRTVEIDGTMAGLYTENKTEELHEPSGHHLLVDIKSVNGKFLNSEEKLAQAMIDLVELSGLTMLSYHCHRMQPVGVSCVGVLLESHISIHTWPIPGAICLDLFTCGPNSLLPILPAIERFFGVPRVPAVHGSIVEKPFVQWAYKLRGFRNEQPSRSDGDIAQFLHGWLEFDLKELVISVDSPFQRIDIYDIINPRFHSLHEYKSSLAKDESYASLHPELFRPDRVVYLDGIMQSRFYGEAAYHEALVHPAMFTHLNPKRVAIIGGGEGATLREVLKHNTVEEVTMIEIDELMVNVSKQYLPEWSDCSMIVGSKPSCFDDLRAEIHFTDAVAWFVERFGEKDKVDPSDKYDVIIMDALDPSSISEFSEVLYGDDSFIRALSNALGDEGILVSQMGEEDEPNAPGAQYSRKIQEIEFVEGLIDQGFQKIEDYAEGHGGYLAVWKYKIAFKCVDCSYYRWHSNQAMIDLEIQSRSAESVEGSAEGLFRYFDGATMMGYQYPSRIVENVFCREVPTPEFCERMHGFDPGRDNVPLESLEVKSSLIPNAGRGVFTKEDIVKGSYNVLDETTQNVLVMPVTTYLIESFADAALMNRWKMFDAYLYGYGFKSDFYGEASYSVDNSILMFLNHGCNGTSSLQSLNITEITADPYHMADELFFTYEGTVYNPFITRSHISIQHDADPVNRDVKAGEELLDNYIGYYTDDTWERGIKDLRAQCNAQSLGSVSSYEETSQ